MDGLCPNCMASGEVGAACGETGCTARRYHFVPAEYVDEGKKGLTRDPFIGMRVQEFLLVRRLGQGGFGAVYLALQLPVMMKTAVKQLLYRPVQIEEEEPQEIDEEPEETLARARAASSNSNPCTDSRKPSTNTSTTNAYPTTTETTPKPHASEQPSKKNPKNSQ